MQDRATPAPFLKWAGGKRQLLPRILDLVPSRIETYYEPFLGGGAVFFALASRGVFTRAILADANPDLIGCYEAVRDDVEAVIKVLRNRRYTNERDRYYAARALDPRMLSAPERAARIVYLNHCGYNGLYRVNSAGQFNVPFGRYHHPTICDADKLRAASRALRGVELRCGDFETALSGSRPGDFVYLDPPYVPVSRTASFTAYAARDFGSADQERLAAALRGLGARGISALLSNSACAETTRLYRPLKIARVLARRAINSAGHARGPVGEILVRSFAYPLAITGPAPAFVKRKGAGDGERARAARIRAASGAKG
jgi:DNA adenine methylase